MKLTYSMSKEESKEDGRKHLVELGVNARAPITNRRGELSRRSDKSESIDRLNLQVDLAP